MTMMIAAAGTGGHVFPGLAVGEALVEMGMTHNQVCYVGGDRLESRVYPEHGFPFLQVALRGLQRSLSPRNLTLPMVVMRARDQIQEAMVQRGTTVTLGMGGYVTIPAALAARRAGSRFMHAEQNAEAGLANRVARRWAVRSFVAFPDTVGLREAEWVGNPVRKRFWSFNRDRLRLAALDRYGLASDTPVLGVFGGSLGAGALNEAMRRLAGAWRGPPVQIVHITGESHLEELKAAPASEGVTWRRLPFEEAMELFYAGCDLVVARAGGAVAELTATATPAVLVPGEFGARGHQRGNARFLVAEGAALAIEERQLETLPEVVADTLFDNRLLAEMRSAAQRIARPEAARTIARAMLEEL